jgi:uncharacterized protein
MHFDPTVLEVCSILFLATVIRSTFGFGEALFAVPLLALVIPVKLAVPVAAVVSVTVALLILLQDWKHVHAQSAGRLVISTLFGIPLGLFVLKTVAEPKVKGALAIIILLFALYSLVTRNPREFRDDRFAWLFGFAAGLLGGAYSMNGPPLVVYGSLRRWSPVQFRATLQGYFLPSSAMVVIGYWATGLATTRVGRLYMWSLPGVIIAVFLGRLLNRRIHPAHFRAFLYVALALIGCILLIQAFMA